PCTSDPPPRPPYQPQSRRHRLKQFERTGRARYSPAAVAAPRADVHTGKIPYSKAVGAATTRSATHEQKDRFPRFARRRDGATRRIPSDPRGQGEDGRQVFHADVRGWIYAPCPPIRNRRQARPDLCSDAPAGWNGPAHFAERTGPPSVSSS